MGNESGPARRRVAGPAGEQSDGRDGAPKVKVRSQGARAGSGRAGLTPVAPDRGPEHGGSSAPRRVTLLNLVAELLARRSEAEVVAAVMDLVERRRVRLVGQFREEHLREEPAPADR